MKTILVETTGETQTIDIPEVNVAYYLGGAPLTFCGTIQELGIVILVKEDSVGQINPYKIPGVQSYRGRALIIQTDEQGIPIDLDFDAYESWYSAKLKHREI